jgi:hypothetical protein
MFKIFSTVIENILNLASSSLRDRDKTKAILQVGRVALCPKKDLDKSKAEPGADMLDELQVEK